MKQLLFISFFLTFISLNAQANLAPCIITREDGNTIQANIKNYKKGMTFEKGIKVRDANNKKLKIEPQHYTQIEVGDALYKSIVNTAGNFRFMLRLVDGPNAELYVDTFTRAIGVPNLGMEMIVTNDFYLKRGEVVQFIHPDVLKETPESYFTGAPDIIEEIKASKKKDFTILVWVEAYNERTLNK